MARALAPRRHGVVPTGSSDPARAHCPHCGHAYKTPRWGREYLCGACGQPLRKLHRSPPFAGLAALAVATCGLLVAAIWLPGARSVSRQAVSYNLLPPLPSTNEVELPGDLRQRLLAQASFYEAELTRLPDHPIFLFALGRAHTKLGILAREQNPEAARKHLERAGILLQKARELSGDDVDLLNRANLVLTMAERPELCYWGAPILASRDGLARSVLEAGVTSPGGAVAPGNFSRVPAAARSMAGAGGNGPQGGSGGQPAAFPYIPPPPAPDPGLLAQRESFLLQRLATHAGDVRAAFDYGQVLEQRASLAGVEPGIIPRPTEEAGEIYRQARAVYLRAAGQARASSHRSALLCAAARVSERLGDHEDAYASLTVASRLTPQLPEVWRELEGVALKTGHTAESHVARRESVAWSLPSLRIR